MELSVGKCCSRMLSEVLNVRVCQHGEVDRTREVLVPRLRRTQRRKPLGLDFGINGDGVGGGVSCVADRILIAAGIHGDRSIGG